MYQVNPLPRSARCRTVRGLGSYLTANCMADGPASYFLLTVESAQTLAANWLIAPGFALDGTSALQTAYSKHESAYW
jgi:hypothetical protein